MEAQLTFREKVAKFFGYGYRVNLNTKEIHRLSNNHINCLPGENKRTMYVNRRTAIELIAKRGFNGCRWCWKEKDTDKKKP